MIKRMIIMLFLCGLVLGSVFGYKMFGAKMMMKYMAAAANPVQTISTMSAKKDVWQPTIKVVGSIRAAKGADLSPEVAGTIDKIFIESGQDVTEGAILLQLNSTDAVAQLKALEAQATLAKLTLDRDTVQLKVKAISQAAFDAAKANYDSLKAQVAQQKAMLEKKTVLAPFSGRLGIRKVDVGQYVPAGTPIVTLQKLDSVFFDFFLPQQNIGRISEGQKIILTTDALVGKTFEGTISAINARVDENTRNIEVRATFANPDKALLPGMFANATINTGAAQSFITLPQTAVTINPYGNTVFVVSQDGTDDNGKPKLVAKTSFIKTGDTRGDQIAILDGIKEGDEVVIAGQLKLRNGSLVQINNKTLPTNDSNPEPADR
ncbi:MAG: efflux RND transporter periplasmic adaptor subunit [Proteobacteria bacterium]|jgi:membrane fusion protein (multidrug efflux system)|nr:efflux RND transporter periplasmic adaptor subunit [Alphaproteobacteria bacterium]NCC03920.1 efflux RND transporter periplasmic adaptor subunit [Pseudomonadota bacterium]